MVQGLVPVKDDHREAVKQLNAKTSMRRRAKEREATLPLRDRVLLEMLSTSPKNQFYYLSPIK